MFSGILLASLLIVPTERDVTLKGLGGLDLRGTLSLPENAKGPVPGVLLLPGSGPTDRNGNQPPAIMSDLLKQIADRLAKEGIASLRFDKRASRTYTELFPKDVATQNEFFAWDKFVGDAKAALEFLRTQPGIDGKRLIIAGHSEGSMIAGAIGKDLAGKPEALAGLILMGAPGRTLDVVIRQQIAASLGRSSLSDQAKKEYMDYFDLAAKQLKESATIPPNTPPGLAPLFPPSAAKLMQAYFTNDPAKTAAGFDGPVLIVQGEKDIQVLAKEDTPPLQAALKARKKGTLEVFIVPSASHNLKHVGDETKEPAIAGTVVPSALDKIVSWIKATMKS